MPLVGVLSTGNGGAVKLGYGSPVAVLTGRGKVLNYALVKGKKGQEAGLE